MMNADEVNDMAIITNNAADENVSKATVPSLLERVAGLDDVIRRGGDEAQLNSSMPDVRDR
jgi:hypothetical protein